MLLKELPSGTTLVRQEGKDDDIEPAPENIPVNENNSEKFFNDWGHDGVCK